MNDAEPEPTYQRDLKGPYDVILASAGQKQSEGHDGRNPGGDAGSSHHRPQQADRSEVRGDEQGLVADVVEAEDVPQQSIEQHGKRDPVTAVRPKEIRGVVRLPRRHELPFVAEEPPIGSQVEEDQRAAGTRHTANAVYAICSFVQNFGVVLVQLTPHRAGPSGTTKRRCAARRGIPTIPPCGVFPTSRGGRLILAASFNSGPRARLPASGTGIPTPGARALGLGWRQRGAAAKHCP